MSIIQRTKSGVPGFSWQSQKRPPAEPACCETTLVWSGQDQARQKPAAESDWGRGEWSRSFKLQVRISQAETSRFRPPNREPVGSAGQARQDEVIRPSLPALLSRCGRDFPSRRGPGSV